MMLRLLILFTAVVGFSCFNAWAVESDEALEPAVLNASLTPKSDVVPGQRVRLRLTVATPRWFTSGTRLRLPEVPGLLILQNQRFASNQTERRDGITWSVQHWTVDLFATRAGYYAIPPIEVSATVSMAPGVDREQQLTTQPLALNAVLPPALANLDHWIASPEVNLQSNLDSAELSLTVGDAIERHITVKASDVMAMMLPSIKPPVSEGLQRYIQPPRLRNRANRGQLLAERDQRTSWIATEMGTAQIPAVSVNWWHTERRELIILRLPTIDIDIAGTANNPKQRPSKAANVPMIAMSILAVLAAAGIYRWRTQLQRLTQQLLSLLAQTWRQLRLLRQPALPNRLNPDGSPGRSSVVTSR